MCKTQKSCWADSDLGDNVMSTGPQADVSVGPDLEDLQSDRECLPQTNGKSDGLRVGGRE